MKQTGWIEPRYIVVILVIVCSTTLYGVGLLTDIGTTPVEPQSVFTLYGAVLGYLFGSHEKKQDQEVEIVKEAARHE
jgi:hypothetical protein